MGGKCECIRSRERNWGGERLVPYWSGPTLLAVPKSMSLRWKLASSSMFCTQHGREEEETRKTIRTGGVVHLQLFCFALVGVPRA